ncbi:MAG TPA: dehydrogenase [Thauera sp.]|nr:dehydrogenase [Thauera sp.]HHW65716.1 zinc-binding alcohol dehydrogenase [Rhodocyclaceae bacterium]
MPETNLAFWTASPGCGELRPVTVRPPAAGEVLVRSLYGAVSRGTESLVFRGEVPESEYQRMRAPFQEGEFPGPVKYGYISVGIVEDGVGPEAAALRGRMVFCLHPHQTRYVVPARAVIPLPPGVPAARAVLAANMETAINACWDGRPAVGDHIAVVGAGVVGSLVASLCAAIPGTEVQLIDIDPGRARLAAALGLAHRLPAAAHGDCDLVFHASGHPAGLATALELAGQEATVIEMSWYGRASVPLPLGGAFHARRLNIKSSQVGHIPPQQGPRWAYRRRMELALSMLVDPRLDALISGETDFQDLPALMQRLAYAPAGALCERIRYPGIGSHDTPNTTSGDASCTA